MTYLWFTDLDRTLIHSNFFLKDYPIEQTACVEFKDNDPLSYMDKEGIELLRELQQIDNLYIIPVTARSIEQYRRIELFKSHKGFAITSNGGSLLENNAINQSWHDEMLEAMQDIDLNAINDYLNATYSGYLSRPFKSVDDTSSYTVINSAKYKEAVEKFTQDKNVNNQKIYTTIQASKVYITPRAVTKEIAVKKMIARLKLNHNFIKVIASGDGLLDKDFVSVADLRFAPVNTPLAKAMEGDIDLVADGMKGTVEMLKKILKIVRE